MTTSVHLKISLIALVVLSLHQITSAQFLYQDCYDGFGSFGIGSDYLTNINEAITQLSSLASTSYYNTATIGTGTDKVNALFYCRYDVTLDVCQSCVTGSIDKVSSCSRSVESIQFYQECTVHYSNRTIAAVLEGLPRYSVHALRTVNDDGEFDLLLSKTFTSLIIDTVTGFSILSRYFATTTAKYSSLQTIYALAQCNEDITSSDCSDCLQFGFGNFTEKYPGAFLGQVFMPSCRLSYKLSSVKMTAPYDFDIRIVSNTPDDSVPPLSSPSDSLTPSSPTLPDQGLNLTPPPPPPPPLATLPQGLFNPPAVIAGSTGTTRMSATIASMVLLCFVLLL